MQLSIRLQAVADLAKAAERLADIGTDHGYLPIYLAQQGKLKSAIAMDINKGPLLRAQENIKKYHMEHMISTRLSDGAKKLLPEEVDTVVIAGMGGALTIKILQESEEVLRYVNAFILQPQSEIASVRRYLHQHGFLIEQEDMVYDEGKYYPMMRAVHGEEGTWTELEYRFGKYLLMKKNDCLKQFLGKEEDACRKLLEDLATKEGSAAKAAQEKWKRELEFLIAAREEIR